MKLTAVFVLLAGVWAYAEAKVVTGNTKNDICQHPFVDISGRCIFVDNFASMNWDSARSFCQGFSGELVTLDEANFLQEIYDFIQREELTGHSYWIGASDRSREGEFVWTDDSVVRMGTPFWGNNDKSQQPTGGTNENCVGLNKDNFYFFNDFNCDSKMALICEFKM